MEKLLNYLDERIADCRRLRESLAADDRKDESIFEQVRENVYNIFRTVLNVGGKICASPEEAEQFFLKRTAEIPASWKTALESAEKHGETEKAMIETIKLEAAQEVTEAYRRFREEEDA